MNIQIIFYAIVAYHVGLLIPVPGIILNQSLFAEVVKSSDFWQLINHLIAAGTLQSKVGLFAVGFIPYVSAKILTSTLIGLKTPALGLDYGRGEYARIKNRNITYYVTLVFSVIYSNLIIFGFVNKEYIYINSTINTVVSVMFLMVGAIFVTFLIHLINEKGKFESGEGVLSLSSLMIVFFENASTNINSISVKDFFLLLFLLLILGLLIFISKTQRKIVISTKNRSGRTNRYESYLYHAFLYDFTHYKPIIMSATFASLLATILNIDYLNILQLIVTVLFIPIFSYIITMTSYPFHEDVDNLKKSGSYIPGIKPGKMTEDYIVNVLSRLSIESGIFKAALFLIVAIFFSMAKYDLNPVLVFSKCAIISSVGSQFYLDIEAKKMMSFYSQR